MQKNKINKSSPAGYLILIFFLAIGCYEKKEGCLDVLAVNFDAGADKNCCCNYPELTLDIKHAYDSTNLSLNAVYKNEIGQDFRVLSLEFFLSDVQLRSQDRWVSVSNVIEFLDKSGIVHTRPDDVTIVNRQTFRFPVGDFLTPGTFDQLRFSIGLKAPESNADPTSVSNSHPLSASHQLWDPAAGYLSYRISLIDTLRQDTLYWTTPAQTTPLVDFDFDINLDKPVGEDLVIPMQINYSEWFNSVDIRSDTPEEIHEKVRAGMQSSFTLLK